MQMKEYKYILLDLDGTITDPMIGKTVAQLRQELISKTQNKWSNE